jgi:hypothetical protein
MEALPVMAEGYGEKSGSLTWKKDSLLFPQHKNCFFEYLTVRYLSIAHLQFFYQNLVNSNYLFTFSLLFDLIMMKKSQLIFLLLLLGSSALYAQCNTCRLGQHDPTDNSAQTNRVLNGNQTLAQSYILQNVCGLHYVTSTVVITTRPTWQPGTGYPAPLSIAALCGVNHPQKAYVYYDASYTEASAPATTVTIKNPAAVTNTYPSVLIGTGPSKCWGETGTAVYRADVTAAISGNGAYSITSINGFANAAYEVDGATLIIIYTTAAAWSGSIVLWDGCWTLIGGTASYTGTGFSACAAASTAQAFCAYGDMQNNVNANINTEQYNGVTQNFTNVFWNFDLINTTLTNGQNSCVFNSYTNNGGDCWLWAFAGLYWQNTTCAACATSCVLPIKLMYFNCTPTADNSVNTSWATATETNNKEFEVQRSADGNIWQTIATVPGAGNSDKTLYYNYNDDSPLAGISYYRLKQIDYDGNYTSSTVQSVTISAPTAEVFPNPTSGNLTLTYYAQNAEQINATIMDLTGKVVMNNPLQAQAGANTYTLNTPSAPGMYIVQIGNAEHKRYVKFVKE